jgi:hypothetical protein
MVGARSNICEFCVSTEAHANNMTQKSSLGLQRHLRSPHFNHTTQIIRLCTAPHVMPNQLVDSNGRLA